MKERKLKILKIIRFDGRNAAKIEEFCKGAIQGKLINFYDEELRIVRGVGAEKKFCCKTGEFVCRIENRVFHCNTEEVKELLRNPKDRFDGVTFSRTDTALGTAMLSVAIEKAAERKDKTVRVSYVSGGMPMNFFDNVIRKFKEEQK